jgi:membrane protease YdiL (CAAX protease family)
VVAVVAEATSFWTAALYPPYWEGTEAVLYSALRKLPLIALYLGLFRADVFDASTRRPMRWHPLFLAVLAFDLCVLAYGGTRGFDPTHRAVTVALVPIFAFREELFDRAILQTALNKVVGPGTTVFMSTLVFVGLHATTVPLTLTTTSYLVAHGMLYATVFQQTRNVWLTTALHATCNVVATASPGSPTASIGLFLAGNIMVVMWTLAWWAVDREARQRDSGQ